MEKDSCVYVAGHNGMVGSAFVRKLQQEGYSNILCKSHNELDLTNQNEVDAFFRQSKIDYCFLAAAKVGGIHANNTYPAQFIYENLMIACNVIHAAYTNGVKKLLSLGSSCIYPKMASQPISESELLSGYLEKTNEAYALAKISGIKMCEFYNRQYGTNYISCMPTNIYGINDNYHPMNAHVLPSLIRRFHESKVTNAKEVVIWGTGQALREFLFVDDLADACLFLMENYNDNETINVGTGEEISITDLAKMVKSVVGYTGEIVYDKTKPDGTPRKLLDINKLSQFGWKHNIKLIDGINIAYKDFLTQTAVDSYNG